MKHVCTLCLRLEILLVVTFLASRTNKVCYINKVKVTFRKKGLLLLLTEKSTAWSKNKVTHFGGFHIFQHLQLLQESTHSEAAETAGNNVRKAKGKYYFRSLTEPLAKGQKGIWLWLSTVWKIKNNIYPLKQAKQILNKGNSLNDSVWPTWLVTEAILLIEQHGFITMTLHSGNCNGLYSYFYFMKRDERGHGGH